MSTKYLRKSIKIKRELSSSMLNKLYEIEDVETGEVLVLKQLNENYKELESRFKKEYLALKNAQINGVVKVYFYGVAESNKMPFFVMEHVEGVSISKHLSNNPFDVNVIFIELLEILNNLHKLGLCHGDIKDENIMITENGKIKVIDFGLMNDITQDCDYSVIASIENLNQNLEINRTFNLEELDRKYSPNSDFNYLFKLFSIIIKKNNAAKQLFKYNAILKASIDWEISYFSYGSINHLIDKDSNNSLSFEERETIEHFLSSSGISTFTGEIQTKDITADQFSEFVEKIITNEISRTEFYKLWLVTHNYRYFPNSKIDYTEIKKLESIFKENPSIFSVFQEQVKDILKATEIELELDLPF